MSEENSLAFSRVQSEQSMIDLQSTRNNFSKFMEQQNSLYTVEAHEPQFVHQLQLDSQENESFSRKLNEEINTRNNKQQVIQICLEQSHLQNKLDNLAMQKNEGENIQSKNNYSNYSLEQQQFGDQLNKSIYLANQIKKSVSSSEQLEKIKQKLRLVINQKKKKFAQDSNNNRSNRESPKNHPFSKYEFRQIKDKYKKYKELYIKEASISKKLRDELRKIYQKVRELQ